MFRIPRYSSIRRILLLTLMMIGISIFGTPKASAGDTAMENTPRFFKSISIKFADQSTPLMERIKSILADRIQNRCDPAFNTNDEAGFPIILAVRSGIGAEGYRISDLPAGGVEITGNDSRGLLYGVGKFLRVSGFNEGEFTPGAWRGTSIPEAPMRGIYLATHLGNWYDLAPIEDIRYYVEDLALWGTNSVLVWFDMSIFNGIEDPRAQANIVRLVDVLKTAKDLGLGVNMGTVSNEGYANSPEALRADRTIGHDGYFMQPPMFPTDLCPSKPEAMELTLKAVQDRFTAFKSVGCDYFYIWPYDNGGCTCAQCAPWGGNGFLASAEKIARVYRSLYPAGKIVLGTWCFDRFVNGEWDGVTRKFNTQRPDWVDYIMIGQPEGRYSEYPLKNGAPGGIPLLEFPEISMFKHSPWGGYGANPMPGSLQGLWDITRDHLSGGTPYSEGQYEDINKAIISQFYWNKSQTAAQTVKEYISYHYSPAVVDGVSQAINILEQNLERGREDKDGATRILMTNTKDADIAFALITEADGKLSPRVRTSWRWRILYLRALIDSELASHELRVSEKCKSAFDELAVIYGNSERTNENLRVPRNFVGVAPD